MILEIIFAALLPGLLPFGALLLLPLYFAGSVKHLIDVTAPAGDIEVKMFGRDRRRETKLDKGEKHAEERESDGGDNDGAPSLRVRVLRAMLANRVASAIVVVCEVVDREERSAVSRNDLDLLQFISIPNSRLAKCWTTDYSFMPSVATK